MLKEAGAPVNNLKNIDVEIPSDQLTVITGLSGSGKSSLAFDTIFAEGQRRYIDTFSSYARNFLGGGERPDVDKISGLAPVISIDQRTVNRNPRSTVGTQTEIYDFLRLLFAKTATAYSYETGEPMVKYTDEMVMEMLFKMYGGKRVILLAPLVRGRKGHYRELFETLRRKGYLHVRVDGEIKELQQGMKVDRYQTHYIEAVIDRIKVPMNVKLPVNMELPGVERLIRSINKGMRQGDGLIMVLDFDTKATRFFSRRLMCQSSGLSYGDQAPITFSFNKPAGACPECEGMGYTFEYDEDEVEIPIPCTVCGGKRLKPESLSYKVCGKNIVELSDMTIRELAEWIDEQTKVTKVQEEIFKEMKVRLKFINDVGLDYLSLSRRSATLSGGESQRIRIATQIGSQLVNVLYILDEPSIGLHFTDNQRLIDSLKRLRDSGNTVIVVEHDEDIMRQAEYIVDIGPGAGRFGGEVVFTGTPAELLKSDTLTAQYLNGTIAPLEPQNRKGNGKEIVITDCTGNNLKNVTLHLPLGKLVVVTGVSGSGKSTLVNDTLYPALAQHFYHGRRQPLPHGTLSGVENIGKVVNIDQRPMGRAVRSTTATYTGVFDDIRNFFATLPESLIRGYKPGRFSFNTKGGRCEECQGYGFKTIEMNFLPDVNVPCEVCQGKRYNSETLQVRFKRKSISDVLDLSIDQAAELFEKHPNIIRKLNTLQEVGLGYVKLGQPTSTLSGGECQRVKLATDLYKKEHGRTLYILDEPTTGLHFHDIRILMELLQKLVDRGNSVLIIEHNTQVINLADHTIELGPEGGKNGGYIIKE